MYIDILPNDVQIYIARLINNNLMTKINTQYHSLLVQCTCTNNICDENICRGTIILKIRNGKRGYTIFNFRMGLLPWNNHISSMLNSERHKIPKYYYYSSGLDDSNIL